MTYTIVDPFIRKHSFMKTIYAFLILILPFAAKAQTLESTLDHYIQLLKESNHNELIEMSYLVKIDSTVRGFYLDMVEGTQEEGVELSVAQVDVLNQSVVIQDEARKFCKIKLKSISTIDFSSEMTDEKIDDVIEMYKYAFPNISYQADTRMASYTTYTAMLGIYEEGKWYFVEEMTYSLGLLDEVLKEEIYDQLQ